MAVQPPADEDDSSLEVADLAGSDALHLLRQYICEALLARIKGVDTGAYSHLVREVRQLKDQAALGGDGGVQEGPQAVLARAQLANMLAALAGHVSLLHERAHEALLSQVLGIQLWTAPQEVRSAALQLVQHLALHSGQLALLSLRMLVQGLAPPPRPPLNPAGGSPPASAPAGAWRPEPHAALVQDQVVAVLLKVLALVPTAPSRLLPVLAIGLPHKCRDRDAHCLALRGVFALAASPAAAPIREGLLAAVVDQLLELDVEIRWQDISERSDEPEDEENEVEKQAALDAEVEDMFELEGMTQLELEGGHTARHAHGSGQQHRGGWEGAPAPAQVPVAQRTAADEQADKLDAMMELTLQHLADRAAAEGGGADGAWATLLAALERALLPTQRSKFTQFLLFAAAAQEPERRCREMLALLLRKLADARVAPLTRAAAAAYAGSFLARAAFVPPALVVTAVQELAKWCWQYCAEQDARAAAARPATSPPPAAAEQPPAEAIAQHQVFYSAFQAMLYVLCYHLEGIMQPGGAAAASPVTNGLRQPAGASGEGGSLSGAVRHLFRTLVPQLLAHRLEPLGACNVTVVAEFSALTVRLALLPRGSIAGSSDGALGAAGGAAAHPDRRPLEMFFPFDPYLLRRSARFLDLEETYVYWRKGHAQQAGCGAPGGASDAASSDDDDEGAKQAEEAEESDAGSSGSSDSDADDEARSLPSASEQRPIKRGASGAFQPIVAFGNRARSAEVLRPVAGSAASSSLAHGSLSTEGTDAAMGASPWGTSYGASPGGMNGVSGMSWAPEVRINGFMARAQSEPGSH